MANTNNLNLRKTNYSEYPNPKGYLERLDYDRVNVINVNKIDTYYGAFVDTTFEYQYNSGSINESKVMSDGIFYSINNSGKNRTVGNILIYAETLSGQEGVFDVKINGQSSSFLTGNLAIGSNTYIPIYTTASDDPTWPNGSSLKITMPNFSSSMINSFILVKFRD